MAKIVSVINWKGGVGKTTLTLHLGVGMAKFSSKKVLLVDLDPQCNLSFLAMGVEGYVNRVYKQGLPTLKTVFDDYFQANTTAASTVCHPKLVASSPGHVWTYVDMILSHQELVPIDLKLARTRRGGADFKEDTRYEVEKLSILARVLAQVQDKYDYILLDCPPNVNLVTQNAFYASDYYVVPAIPDFLSTTGISLIRDYMDGFNKDFAGMHAYAGLDEPYRVTQFGGIIFNMVDEYGGKPKQTHDDQIDTVKGQHPGMVLDSYVTDGDGISVAASVNLPVYAYEHLPRSGPNAKKQAEYLERLTAEFITKVV